jgi:AcrR family transcriptional regulator
MVRAKDNQALRSRLTATRADSGGAAVSKAKSSGKQGAAPGGAAVKAGGKAPIKAPGKAAGKAAVKAGGKAPIKAAGKAAIKAAIKALIKAPITAAATAAAKAPVLEPKRRIRLDTDERRAQLLKLARRVFTERAYDDVSIDDIAVAAGISKGLLYHYFPTKRDLYVASLREISGELMRTVNAAIDDSQPPAERVRAALDAYLQHVATIGNAFVALMRGGIGSDPEVADVVESTRRSFIDQFLQRSPIAAQFAIDPLVRLGVRGWIGMVEATSIEWVSQPTVPRPAVRDMLVDNLLAVLMKVRQPGDRR